MNKIEAGTVTPGEYPVNVRVRAHSFSCDASIGAGGQDTAPGPHDLFDSALATCKAITAMWYAKRHGIPLERIETQVETDGKDERTGVYRMRVHVDLFGPLTPEQHTQVQRAIAACPIHKLMTTADVQIEIV
jgi:putative redox protein